MELRFIRDTDKREVDFVVLRDGHPEFEEMRIMISQRRKGAKKGGE